MPLYLSIYLHFISATKIQIIFNPPKIILHFFHLVPTTASLPPRHPPEITDIPMSVILTCTISSDCVALLCPYVLSVATLCESGKAERLCQIKQRHRPTNVKRCLYSCVACDGDYIFQTCPLRLSLRAWPQE